MPLTYPSSKSATLCINQLVYHTRSCFWSKRVQATTVPTALKNTQEYQYQSRSNTQRRVVVQQESEQSARKQQSSLGMQRGYKTKEANRNEKPTRGMGPRLWWGQQVHEHKKKTRCRKCEKGSESRNAALWFSTGRGGDGSRCR